MILSLSSLSVLLFSFIGVAPAELTGVVEGGVGSTVDVEDGVESVAESDVVDFNFHSGGPLAAFIDSTSTIL